jgi:hypothetical protein
MSIITHPRTGLSGATGIRRHGRTTLPAGPHGTTYRCTRCLEDRDISIVRRETRTMRGLSTTIGYELVCAYCLPARTSGGDPR